MKIKDIRGVLLVGTRKRTSNSYGENLPYMSYRVFMDTKKGLIPIQELYTPEELKELSYWKSRSKTLAMTCWGTSQYFHAQLAIGRFLKMEKKVEDWGAYTRRVTSFCNRTLTC